MIEGYINVNHHYPKDGQKVQINFQCEGEERVIRGFFSMNRTKPKFTALGSEILNVVGWKPCESNIGFI